MSNAPTISPLTRQAPFFSSPLNTPDISRFYSPSIKRPSPTTKEPEEEPTLRTKRRKTSSSDGESSVITVRRRSNNDSSNDAAPIFKPSEMQITNSIERGDSQEEPNSKIERAIALGSTAVAQVDSPGPERVMAETIQNRSLKGQPINDITSLEGQAQGVGNNDTRRDAEIAGVSNSGISGFDEQQNQQLNGEVPASTAALTARPARCQAQKPNKEQCKNKAASAKCFGNSGNDEAKVSLARFCRVHQKVEIRKAQKKPPATAANTKKKRAAKPAPVTTAERKIWAGAAAKGQPKQPEIQPASAPRTRRSNEKSKWSLMMLTLTQTLTFCSILHA